LGRANARGHGGGEGKSYEGRVVKLKAERYTTIPMAIPDDVSHGDIYHKLGSLEGKLETVVIQLTERRSDIAAVFARLREVEIRVAVGVGVAAVLSFLIPLLVNAASPKLHIGPQPLLHQTR
jgi:hypothetical protein